MGDTVNGWGGKEHCFQIRQIHDEPGSNPVLCDFGAGVGGVIYPLVFNFMIWKWE